MKSWRLLLALLLFALPASAQVSYVTVTGNNASYKSGTLQATFFPPAGSSQLAYLNLHFPMQVTANLDGSGNWTMQLADNNSLAPAPAGSQWQLNLCSQRTAQFAPTCYLVTQVITGTSMDLTAAFSGAPTPGGGGGNVNLPANSIPYQGNVGTQPVAATPANIAAPFSSTAYVSGSYTAINSTFNEGSIGATILGSKPATDVPGGAWSTLSGTGAIATFQAGGGKFGPASGNCGIPGLNTGSANNTITLTGVTLTGSDVVFGVRTDAVAGSLDQVAIDGSGNVTVREYPGGTTIGTGSIGATRSGTITFTLNGTSFSLNIFGNVISGTSNITGQNFSFQQCGAVTGNTNTSTMTIGQMQVTTIGVLPSTVACSGYLNSDGTCSTTSINTIAALDGGGHFVNLLEKGTSTTATTGQVPATTIAWQDDFRAGVYDPRDPRWGAQDTPAHQAATLQAMSNRMACDLATGAVTQAVAKFPQGFYWVDNLQMAPGSVWLGTASAAAGTTLHSLINNHKTAQMPLSMAVMCSDGSSHTDSNTGGIVAQLNFVGCSQGGCTNAPGDTANYQVGGPGNTGLEMSNPGRIDYVNAQAFGGYGIRVDSIDTKAFHLRAGSGGGNDEWYLYGGYKGVNETAGSPESTGATIAGSTGSVALTWTAVPSATGYVLYRGTSPGAENTAYLLGNVTSVTDTCAASSATGILGTVTNVVTNSLATPAAPTATPSETGGTCAPGTYYYKITATTVDGWHGSIELVGTDVMADWVEAYGFSDDPTVFNYHHLADIVSGGGGSHFDHFWPQLGQVGIAQPSTLAVNDQYENVRVDFTRLEGMYILASGVHINGGLIQGSCKSSNSASLNTGQTDVHWAGTCDQLVSLNSNVSNIQFVNPGGFGPYYSTADYLIQTGEGHNLSGTSQFITNEGSQRGIFWEPDTSQITNVLVDGNGSVNINGLHFINPNDSSAKTYNRFVDGAVGQDVYVQGGNANVTLSASSGYYTLCGKQNINLGNVTGFLHFVIISSGADLIFSGSQAKEVCDANAVTASSETVASSATPTFAVTTRASITTLTANVTTFTLAAGTDGQEKTLTFCQNATGGFTVAAPANVHGFMTVGTTASKCSAQHFTYSAGQSAWLADSAGVTNE